MEPSIRTRSARVFQGDALEILQALPADSVHCCATSPPYFGLRAYLQGKDRGREIGSEASPDAYIASLVALFREVRRVLHPAGTLWLNLGDSYAVDPRKGASGEGKNSAWLGGRQATRQTRKPLPEGLPQKNLMMIPARVALALQADGWLLRSMIPWLKRNSMPTSAEDRPGTATEYVFLLTRSPDYFYDRVAVQRPISQPGRVQTTYRRPHKQQMATGPMARGQEGFNHQYEDPGRIWGNPEDRNRRDADWWFESWQGLYQEEDEPLALPVNLTSYRGAHFATWPPKLVLPMIQAGTSQHGCCPACKAPWQRLVEKQRTATRPGDDTKVQGRASKEIGNRDPARHVTVLRTTGWQPTCKCPDHKPEPCVVLDPFTGSGTTGQVALEQGRQFLGCELNPDYLPLIRERLNLGERRRGLR